MAKYTVQSPIKSGGKIHAVGAAITLDDAIAAPLLAKGRIEVPGGVTNSTGASSTKEATGTGDGARQAPEPPAKKTGAKK
jgi:hypothetical protein